jgi:Transposase DDE domain
MLPVAQSRTPPGLKRGRKKRPALEAQQVTGRKYLQILRPYLQRLHAAYPHPNRVLFYDDVVVSYLVAFFSPALRSLRLIEDASQVPGVNKFLNVDAVCSSTLSDANALFDPAHLAGLIADLRADLPVTARGPRSDDPQLMRLLDKAVLVDGSFFRLASDVQWAIHAANQYGGGKGTADAAASVNASNAKAAQGSAKAASGKPGIALKPGKTSKPKSTKPGIGTVRLNCQYCLASGVPTGVSINGSDGVHESTAAEAFVEPDHLYVFDSGIVSFDYLRKILSTDSHLVCNLSKTVNFTALTDRPLSAQDIKAGIISDRSGYLSGSHRNTPPKNLFREIIVQYTDRSGNIQCLRLLTDLMDISAFTVAEIYRQRWQIELFFRWLKVSANFRHLCSHSRNGVSLSFHMAVIAALLMILRTGKPLSVYGHSLLCLVAAGQADLRHILPILEKRERERRLERERLARKRAAQKSA